MPKEEGTFRWKGKYVSEDIYTKRREQAMKQTCLKSETISLKNVVNVSIAEEKIRETEIVMGASNAREIIRLPEIETVLCKNSNEENLELGTEELAQENKILEGRRIVDLSELGRLLWCGTCREALSLKYIEKEFRRGLGSFLLVRCHKCLIVNEVATGTMHVTNTDRRGKRFDINTDLALGILNSGLSLSMMNKIHNYLKIPSVNHGTYKKYQEEIGEEEVAAIKARRNQIGPSLEEES